MKKRFMCARMFGAAALIASCALAEAAGYPDKPITMIVAFPPGAAFDRVARIMAEGLHAELGQPLIVQNRAGAAGNIGTEAAYNAYPDGYTVLFTVPAPLVINKALYSNLAFDPDRFTPISVVASSTNVLVASPKLGAVSLEKLFSIAKSSPGKLNYASGGVGSASHLSAELMQSMANIKLVHIPYKGVGDALRDLLGGRVDMMFIGLGSVLPHIGSGKLRALAVGSQKRDPLLPNTPAVSEALPGFLSTVWYGIVAPPNTSPEVVSTLSTGIVRVLKKPDVAKRVRDQGVEPVGSTAQEMTELLIDEKARWGKVLEATGARLE